MQLQTLLRSNQENESSVNHSQIIDPREQLLEELEQQNDQLLQEVVKAKHVFEENLIKKNEIISVQATTIEELQAELIRERERNEELSAMHEAAMKAEKESRLLKETRLASLIYETNASFDDLMLIPNNLQMHYEYQVLKGHYDEGWNVGWRMTNTFNLMNSKYQKLVDQPPEVVRKGAELEMEMFKKRLTHLENETKSL